MTNRRGTTWGRPDGRPNDLGLWRVVVLLWLAVAAPRLSIVAAAEPAVGPFAQWKQGPPHGAEYFPIAVWLQDPRQAKRYQELGFNLYVGLWQGPTGDQLAALKAAGMPVICEQNPVGLTDRNRDIIVGWMHGDEPDNAQTLGASRGYGPPVDPGRVVADYRRIHQADSSRPILLNLGQGVAWDGWYGRGVRTNHPEDYAAYLEGCDIASFDIYPVVHDSPEVAGKLEFVARGVDRLRDWSRGRRIIWNCIECTRISNEKVRPNPAHVRSEVWMALIHGSQGLIYFVHQFKPKFIEAGLLADNEMARAVGVLNRQIRDLSPVLNSPTIPGAFRVTTADSGVPVDVMVKRSRDATYVFAVAMRNQPVTATFQGPHDVDGSAEVLGEGRLRSVTGGAFSDQFAPYEAHLYRLPSKD